MEHLSEMLFKAQQGDPAAREELLSSYRPFVLRVASAAAHRYILPEHDDEYSIALIAFNEAINSFVSERNGSFLSFAEVVIRRRLTDYFRRQGRMQNEMPLSGLLPEDEEEEPGFAIYEAKQRYVADNEANDRRMEVEEFCRALARYGIKFTQLVASSPHHRDTREHLQSLTRSLVNNSTLRALLEKNRELPYAQLSHEFGVTTKTLRRHRAYIIATYLIFTGDFPYLREYVKR
jgi:RNA polymerase sigma factor